MFPKIIVLLIKISRVFPVNAFTAGMEVITAITSTKIKLAFALIECGSNGMEIIPAIGNPKAKERNKKSGINILYRSYYLFISW